MAKKLAEPSALFTPAERLAALADIYASILKRRQARLDQAKNKDGNLEVGKPDVS